MTPPSLLGPDLAPLWEAVRQRLERRGSTARGRLRVPPLSTLGRHRLSSLLDRTLTATVDLTELELALAKVGAGTDLVAVLTSVGHAMSFDGEHRRRDRQVRRAAREAARAAVADWTESWAAVWIEEAVQTGLLRGLDVHDAIALVASVRRCLDAVQGSDPPQSRVDLAAAVLGDAHALDPGTRLGPAVMRALRQRHATELHDDTDRTVWDRAGVPTDSVSAPVLTWNLPVDPGTALASMIAEASSFGVVTHLSAMALRSYPVVVAAGTDVLVTENPRVVEAAAQRRSPCCVVSTNGNPSMAVRLLLAQLLRSGADVRYHGDFDAAGLSICRRMMEIGLAPWKMDTASYERAVAAAAAERVELPIDPSDPGPTPWDESLREAFQASRRVVHEERLLDELLGNAKAPDWSAD